MTYDTVFISDTHLGTPRCNTDKLLKFLKELKTKKIVLVGDIIDIYCMEKYHTRWTKEHTECIHQLLKIAQKRNRSCLCSWKSRSTDKTLL